MLPDDFNYKTDTLPKSYFKGLKLRVYERDGWLCYYCGWDLKAGYEAWKNKLVKKRTDIALTVDHFIPKIKGGRTIYENLVACCKNCNLSKGGESPENWVWPSDDIKHPVLIKRLKVRLLGQAEHYILGKKTFKTKKPKKDHNTCLPLFNYIGEDIY